MTRSEFARRYWRIDEHDALWRVFLRSHERRELLEVLDMIEQQLELEAMRQRVGS